MYFLMPWDAIWIHCCLLKFVPCLSGLLIADLQHVLPSACASSLATAISTEMGPPRPTEMGPPRATEMGHPRPTQTCSLSSCHRVP